MKVANLRAIVVHSLVSASNTNYNDTEWTALEPSYADPVLNMQIRFIALAGICKAEEFIIRQFDNLSRLLSLDRFSLMVAKTCLLRLMLIYRNDVLLCKRSIRSLPIKSQGERMKLF
jgi:hypothetical protein